MFLLRIFYGSLVPSVTLGEIFNCSLLKPNKYSPHKKSIAPLGIFETRNAEMTFLNSKTNCPLVTCQVQSFLLPFLNRRNSAQHAKLHKSCFAIAVVTSFSLSWVFVALFLWLVTVMWSSGYKGRGYSTNVWVWVT